MKYSHWLRFDFLLRKIKQLYRHNVRNGVLSGAQTQDAMKPLSGSKVNKPVSKKNSAAYLAPPDTVHHYSRDQGLLRKLAHGVRFAPDK